MPAATRSTRSSRPPSSASPQGGQTLAGLLVFITDVHALGLQTAQGLVLTEAFYWDLNDQTRAWSERFAKQNGGKMPTMVQAGVYAGVLHYLKAVEATERQGHRRRDGQDEGDCRPTTRCSARATIRADGRKIHDMYLFEVKTPAESKGPWDYYKTARHHPGGRGLPPARRGRLPAGQRLIPPRGRASACPLSRLARMTECSSSSAFRRRRCSASCCSG